MEDVKVQIFDYKMPSDINSEQDDWNQLLNTYFNRINVVDKIEKIIVHEVLKPIIDSLIIKNFVFKFNYDTTIPYWLQNNKDLIIIKTKSGELYFVLVKNIINLNLQDKLDRFPDFINPSSDDIYFFELTKGKRGYKIKYSTKNNEKWLANTWRDGYNLNELLDKYYIFLLKYFNKYNDNEREI